MALYYAWELQVQLNNGSDINFESVSVQTSSFTMDLD